MSIELVSALSLTASASRDALGLGNSSTEDVGTTAGTVAAGDDSRIVGAAQKSANLSDLTNTATARANLDLGTAALSAATDFATAAQGALADSAVQPGDLGNSASLNVGTTAGTVAAGNDPRFSGTLTRTALKSLDTTVIQSVYLFEGGREGQFLWRTGDYSSFVTNDPGEGIYIKADAIATTVGAWVRQFNGALKDTWFGATPSSMLDQLIPLQRALNFQLAYGGELEFSKGFYLLSGPLVAALGGNSLRIEGDGTAFGTQFKVLAGSFTGTSILKIVGPTGVDKTYDMDIRNFALINDTGGPTIGLEFDGPADSSTAAYKETLCESVLIANFEVGCSLKNWRQINFSRVGIWQETVANAKGFDIGVGAGASAFCGDFTFEKCQVSQGGSGTSFAWNIYSAGTNAISIAGIRITNPIVYKSSNLAYVNAAAATAINDIWIKDGQLDGPAGNGMTLDANVSGGSINTIHYTGNYHTANTGQIFRAVNSNGATISTILVESNTARGGTAAQILLESGTGGNAANIDTVGINDNKFKDISVGSGALTDTCIFINAGDNVTINNNSLHHINAVSLDSFILAGAGTNILITSNNSGSYSTATGWTACVVNLVPITDSNNI